MQTDPHQSPTHAAFIVRRPILPAAICFAIGIFSYRAVPALPFFWLIVTALSIAAAILLRSRAIGCAICIGGAFLFSGILSAQLERFYFPRAEIGLFATATPRLAQLELLIDHEPRILTDQFAGRPLPPKQVVDAKVVRVLTKSGWIDATGEMLVQIVQPNPQLAIGQTVRVLGMLEQPAPAMNPGQFDWADYYREQRMLASVHIPTAGNITILSQSPRSPADWLRAQSREMLAMGFPANRSLDYALLNALMLGDHDPELRDIQDQFRKTGTSHHLSISGFHVAILCGFVFGLCRLLRLRPRTAVTVMLCFAIVYGFAVLPRTPAIRAILLCVLFGIGLLNRRSIDALQLLFVGVLLLLLWHPLDLFMPGFQLSAGIVLGLLIFTPPFARWLETLRRSPLDVDLTKPNKQPTIYDRLRATMHWMESVLWSVFAAGCVAWFVSVPLVAFHFGQLNPWAIAASIVLAPIVFIALAGGLGKIVLTIMLPGFSHAWAHFSALPIVWMRHTLDWLAQLPGSDFPLPAWPVWGLVAVYCFYSLFLIPCPIPKLRIALRLAPIAVLATALILPFRYVERAVVAPKELRLTLLAIGAGQAGVLETPAGKTIVLDAGSSSLTDVLRKCIAPYLRFRQCTRVDAMMLSHSDYDHISAAGGIASVYGASQVYVGGKFRATAQESATATALLQTLDQLDDVPVVVSTGQHIALSRGVDAEILWPPPTGLPDHITSNESAVVARISYAGKSILITGDIQQIAEHALLKNPEKLKADILIAPHHGSSEDTTAAFVRAVDPTYILSSNDRSLTGKQKRFEQLIGRRQLFRTNVCGAITVHIGEDGKIWVEPFLKRSS